MIINSSMAYLQCREIAERQMKDTITEVHADFYYEDGGKASVVDFTQRNK